MMLERYQVTVGREQRNRRSRSVPRVSGLQAAITTCLGIGLMIAAFFVTYGVVIYGAGTFLIGGALALWLMSRYGILDSIERYGDWIRTPRRTPPDSRVKRGPRVRERD